MKSHEIDAAVESLIEQAEGIVDLHTSVWNFAEVYAALMTRLAERADEELGRAEELGSRNMLEEAANEHSYCR